MVLFDSENGPVTFPDGSATVKVALPALLAACASSVHAPASNETS